MAATMPEVLLRYLEEAGRDEPHFLKRSDGSLFVNDDGMLYFDRIGRGRWGNGRITRNIPLSLFIGDRFKGGFMLLNGDGMEDNQAMEWQTRLRNDAQRIFGWERCAIIPFSAINAAELDMYSIRIIEVTQDRQEPVITWIDGVQEALLALVKDPVDWCHKNDFRHIDGYSELGKVVVRGNSSAYNTVLTGNLGPRRMRIELSRNDDYDDSDSRHYYVGLVSIYAQPENGAPSWQSIMLDSEKNSYYWRQMVHRLGAVVFSAKDIHGGKARWLSAFDMHEPEPLYFLAQLPPTGKINNYGDAITALAPPMVQAAIEKQIPVFRQGDVFAVETNWTDEQVYQVAKTRVRRVVAIQDAVQAFTARRELHKPLKEEVTERIACPHCSGGKIEVGCGPEAKKALMILHTGHTADEVVVTSDGRTFIKGFMRHDPHLETPGRVADHRDVALTPDKWFLCIRNTVPRMKTRVTQVNAVDSGVRIPFPKPKERQSTFYTSERLPTIAFPPTGYAFFEYRTPKKGDIWIANNGVIKASGASTGGQKRWILRPVEQTVAEAQAAA